MGIVKPGSWLSEIQGRVGNIVVKHYKDKVVVTKVPEFGKDKPTELQKVYRKEFNKAVAYAKAILKDPEKKKAYKKKAKGRRVYNFAIGEYYTIKKAKEKKK